MMPTWECTVTHVGIEEPLPTEKVGGRSQGQTVALKSCLKMGSWILCTYRLEVLNTGISEINCVLIKRTPCISV
jgi:hypothetical protein